MESNGINGIGFNFFYTPINRYNLAQEGYQSNNPFLNQTETEQPSSVQPVTPLQTYQIPVYDCNDLFNFINIVRHMMVLRQIQVGSGYFNDSKEEWVGDWATSGYFLKNGEFDEAKFNDLLDNIHFQGIDSQTIENVKNLWKEYCNKNIKIEKENQKFLEYDPGSQWAVIYDYYKNILINLNDKIPNNIALYTRLKDLAKNLNINLPERFSDLDIYDVFNQLVGKNGDIADEMRVILFVMVIRHMMVLRQIQVGSGYFNDSKEEWVGDWATSGYFLKNGEFDEAKFNDLLDNIHFQGIDSQTIENVKNLWKKYCNKNIKIEKENQKFLEYDPGSQWAVIYDYYKNILINLNDQVNISNLQDICSSNQKQITENRIDTNFIAAVYKAMGRPLTGEEIDKVSNLISDGTITPDDIQALVEAVYEDRNVYGKIFNPLVYKQKGSQIKKDLTNILNPDNIDPSKLPPKLDRNIYMDMAVIRKLSEHGIKLSQGAMVSASEAVPPNIHWGSNNGSVGAFPNGNSSVYYEMNYNMASLNDATAETPAISDANDSGLTHNIGLHLENQFSAPSWLSSVIGDTYNGTLDLSAWQREGEYGVSGTDLTLGISGGTPWFRYWGNVGATYQESETPTIDNPEGTIGHGSGRLTLMNPYVPVYPFVGFDWRGGDIDAGFPEKFFDGYNYYYVGAEVPLYGWKISPWYIPNGWGWYNREEIVSFNMSGDILQDDVSARVRQITGYDMTGWGVDIDSPEYNIPYLGNTGFDFSYERKEIETYDPSERYNFGISFRDGTHKLDYTHANNPKPLLTPYSEDIVRYTYTLNRKPEEYTGWRLPISIYVEGGTRNFENGPNATVLGAGFRIDLMPAGRDRIIGAPDSNRTIAHKGTAAGDAVSNTQMYLIYTSGKSSSRRGAFRRNLELTNELDQIAGINTLNEAQKHLVARFLEANGYEVRNEDGRIDDKKLNNAIKKYSQKKWPAIDKKLLIKINEELKNGDLSESSNLTEDNLLGATVNTKLTLIRPDMALNEEAIEIIEQDALRVKIKKEQGISIQPSKISGDDPVAKILYYALSQVGEIKNFKVEFNSKGEPIIHGEIEWLGADLTLTQNRKSRIIGLYGRDDFETQFIMEVKAGVIGNATMAVLQYIAKEKNCSIDELINSII